MKRNRMILPAALVIFAPVIFTTGCKDKQTTRDSSSLEVKKAQETHLQEIENNPNIPPAAKAAAGRATKDMQALANRHREQMDSKTTR